MDIREEIIKDCQALNGAALVTDKIRDKVIDKLSEVVDAMQINPNLDKASVLDAKRGLLDTLLKAANDVDARYRGSVKVKQSIKISDDSVANVAKMSKMMTELFKQVKTGGNAGEGDQSIGDLSSILDDQLDDMAPSIDLLDGECEITTKSAMDID